MDELKSQLVGPKPDRPFFNQLVFGCECEIMPAGIYFETMSQAVERFNNRDYHPAIETFEKAKESASSFGQAEDAILCAKLCEGIIGKPGSDTIAVLHNWSARQCDPKNPANAETRQLVEDFTLDL